MLTKTRHTPCLSHGVCILHTCRFIYNLFSWIYPLHPLIEYICPALMISVQISSAAAAAARSRMFKTKSHIRIRGPRSSIELTTYPSYRYHLPSKLHGKLQHHLAVGRQLQHRSESDTAGAYVKQSHPGMTGKNMSSPYLYDPDLSVHGGIRLYPEKAS